MSMSSPVGLLQSLQQAQSMLASMYPSGSAAPGSSDSATIDSFQQILASLSPNGSTAGGILGSGLQSTLGSTTGTATSAAPSSGPTGADVVADAKKYLGVPYVLDGESTKGIDCSGLVQKTYADLGITLPRTVHQQKLMGTAVPSLAQAQPGDLIVFKGGGHVAIYEGNDTVIHAPYPGRVVSNEKLWVGDSGIETIRRIVPSAGTTTTTPTASTPAPAVASTQTSAAVQAAALATVQAMIQADYGLLSSSSSSTSGTSADNSPSSQLQDAISSLGSAGSSDTSTSSSSSTASTTSALQTLAMEKSMLAQEEL